MYLQYYGFSRKPFELVPKIDTLFLGETHKEGLAVLKYGVISDKGFLLLTGGIGTGKTTLINCLASNLEISDNLCIISNPKLDVGEFYYYFAAKIGLQFDGNKARFLLLFSDFLKKCQEKKEKVLLIIDEAHILPIDLLEEVRLLANLSAEYPGSLSIFLVGQPELLERLAEKRFQALRQRIALRFHLEPLSRKDTLQYILFRLNAAGASQGALFTEKAVDAIHQAAKGNPRVINILCDHALLTGYSRNVLRIDRNIVRECVEQQRLPGDEMSLPGDERFYSMPKKKRFWQRGIFWLLLFVLCLEGGAVWLAFYFGLTDGIVEFVQNLLNKG
ncbi:MAG: AAA family ATPase [Deltaproteobacteria bacterium]|nr:AAA family ATPase [Deltaproteobacteria bacterium]MBW2660233.1 AAA family ATPase [Deltaproteobacteria bacterium]